jgi:hypothetical protein
MHEPSLLRLAASMPCVCQGYTTLHVRAEPTEACGWHDMWVSGSGLGLGHMHEPSLLRLGLACHVYVKVILPYMYEPSLLRLAAGMTYV